MALVLLTGVANVGLILGAHLPTLGSPYRVMLAVKVGLVAVMVAIALCNRYVFVPRLSRGKGDAALRAIAVATVVEIILGAAVLALVSAFATFDPV
ncbi:inner membrane protein YebZ [mine drainage metagenome]|uniref:Inner membrane protein YebZ n=1 Tax=mine drainage metagenome TaxID=410659 RepID=A0A1J5PCH0_9ZZZZ